MSKLKQIACRRFLDHSQIDNFLTWVLNNCDNSWDDVWFYNNKTYHVSFLPDLYVKEAKKDIKYRFDIYGNNLEELSMSKKKPPLGVFPRKINDEIRMSDLKRAISEYAQEGLNIDIRWIEEYNELIKKTT